MEKLLVTKFVSATPQEEAVMEGVVVVMCPFCTEEKLIGPAEYYNDVECEVCFGHYSTIGVI